MPEVSSESKGPGSSHIGQRLAELRDRWLPEDFAARPMEVRRQLTTTLHFVMVGLPLSVVLVLYTLIDRDPFALGATLVMVSLMLALPLSVRRGGSQFLIAQVFIGVMYATSLVGGLQHGGIHSGSPFFLAFIPMVAVLVSELRAGRFWLGVTTLCLLGMLGIEFQEQAQGLPVDVGQSVRVATSCMISSLMIYLVASRFQHAQHELFELAEKRTRELEVEKARAEQAHAAALQAQEQIARALDDTAQAHSEAEAARLRLATLDQQKTHFFQNISHELRTPLTLILGPLERAVTERPEDRDVFLALRNARRLLRLVNQLLDFQKLSAGKRDLKLEPLDVLRFCQLCGDYFEFAASAREIDFAVTLEGAPLDDLPAEGAQLFMRAEVDALEKVVFNYLSNALKHTPAGGRIELALSREGAQLRISVLDTGPGVRAEDRPRLFKLFSQVDDSDTRPTEGTGLGLALVKELSEAMGGSVGVDSGPRQGSRFWVCFPVLETSDGVESQTEIQPVRDWLLPDGRVSMPPPAPAVNDTEVLVSGLPGSGSRVLVVDDLSDMRELIATALRDRGYRVSLAGSGEEALQLCGEARPELILTDWMMPGMSGPELIEALRADQDLRCIPVVLLTAKSDEESKLLGTEIGADAFLGKPFNDQELCATVRNLLALKARERDVETLNRRLREQVLERYLAPEVVEAILAGGEEFKLEPTAQLTTVLFADLVNFTRTTQQLRAPRMARVVNQFLAAMNEVVFAHGGTVDKFIGDAVMVLFGAPCSMEPAEQARRAVSCGLAMQAAMGALRIQWEAEGLQGFKLRVGVHLGPAVVGNFGSERRMEYTAIGATVNLAARLEGVCPPGEVCITGELADYLPEAWIDGLGLFDIKGFDGQRRLFRMVAEKVPPWESGLGLDAPVDSVDGGPLKRGRVQREG